VRFDPQDIGAVVEAAPIAFARHRHLTIRIARRSQTILNATKLMIRDEAAPRLTLSCAQSSRMRRIDSPSH
jgi:hypothetical protein